MAMFDPADREEDRLAARRAFYVIAGLGIVLIVFMVAVVAYYNGYQF
jgi:hypothetical protein